MNRSQSQSAKNAPLDLTDFLTSGRHPHSADIPLGEGQSLAITYRAADSARARAAILAAAGAALIALGFDPEVVLNTAAGRVPKGDALREFQSALDALDGEGFARFQDALKLAEGAALADTLGSWGFGDAITPEACAKLPADLTKTILQLSAAAMLPAERLGLLGK